MPGATRFCNSQHEEHISVTGDPSDHHTAECVEVSGLIQGKETPSAHLGPKSIVSEGNVAMEHLALQPENEKMWMRAWAVSVIWLLWTWVVGCFRDTEPRWQDIFGEVDLVVTLHPVDTSGDVEMGDTTAERSGKMRKLPKGILVDSGAGASVADGDKDFPEYKREESAGSKKGQVFLGPGSEKIPNRGQKKVNLTTESGVRSRITFQDSPVRRPILAVSDSTKAGNLVCFDSDESVIIPRDTEDGKKIRDIIAKARRKVTLELEQGVYQIPAWVSPPDAADMKKAPFTGPVQKS